MTTAEEQASTEAPSLRRLQQVISTLTTGDGSYDPERWSTVEAEIDRKQAHLFVGIRRNESTDGTYYFGSGHRTWGSRIVLLGERGDDCALVNLRSTRAKRLALTDTTPVTELTGIEVGVWEVVTTSGTTYVFDLDLGTVMRTPVAGASVTMNDRQRPIREIDICRVGQPGRWTLLSDGGYLGVDYWSASTPIISITRVNSPSSVDSEARR